MKDQKAKAHWRSANGLDRASLVAGFGALVATLALMVTALPAQATPSLAARASHASLVGLRQPEPAGMPGPAGPGEREHPQPIPANAVVVSARPSPYGPILETASGFTLYAFSGDELGFSLPTACSSKNKNPAGVACTTVWPPLLATGPVVAEGGAQQRLLGTVTRPSGEVQVTYDGHPLYRFIADSEPGDINGENLASFFGIWHVVSITGIPDGGTAVVSTEVSPEGVVLSSPTAKDTYRSLYQLTTDPDGQTTCTSATGCSSIWPPLLTLTPPQAGPGVDPRLLGVIKRPDGALQVTYAGRPLYMFAFDLGPGAQPSGETNGEYLIDVHAFGVWYLMYPTGLPDPGTAQLTEITLKGQQVLGVVSGFNAGDFAAYTFSQDSATSSMCTGSCAMAWPPVLTSTPPSASGLPSGSLGTIQRPDGTFQVTFDGHPLYLFSHDEPEEGLGAGISAFGGTFNLASVNGS
jgi:predicted lipoprotein with Yx(FWY)xxD motif